MKQSGFKKKNNILNSYTPLKAKKGFKVRNSTLKKSPWSVQEILSPMSALDSVVSKCIRLGSADSEGMVICVTCARKFHWKIIQCGHFQKRGNLSTRYDIKNLAAQCEDCNCFHDGENEKFAQFINDFYGPGTAEELRTQADQIIHNFSFEEEIQKWQKVFKLLEEKQSNVIQY